MESSEQSDSCLGIIIEQSLEDPEVGSLLNVVARKQPRDWVFLLVEVRKEALSRHLRIVQKNIRPEWHAHYFRHDELVVVFRDIVFRVSTNPSTWRPIMQHGLAKGILPDQLHFVPNNRPDAEAFFRTQG